MFSANELLWFCISLCACAVNYYIGKARGAAQERDRLFRNDPEDNEVNQ